MANGEELTFVVKRFIVQRLAWFDTPSQVVKAVKEEFGLELTRQRVQFYDPTSKAGAALADDLKTLFSAERKKFLEDYTAIPSFNKAVRLRRLEQMLTIAIERNNFVLAAALIEQIAKEVGGAFTNRHEHTGKDGKDLPAGPPSVTIIQLPDNGRGLSVAQSADKPAQSTT